MKALPCILAVALAVAGCQSNASSGALVEGRYAGTATRYTTNPACDAPAEYTLDLSQGQVAGTLRRAAANAPPVAFQSYIDYEGAMFAQVRFAGQLVEIRGHFQGPSFQGEAKTQSPACTYFLTLRRQA
jgi:hypothetical protein